jgi:hypothetical protein
MPQFTFWLVDADWSTPLLLLMIGLLVFFVFLAAFLTWLESFRAYMQDEVEREIQQAPSSLAPFKHHHRRGWRTHHI